MRTNLRLMHLILAVPACLAPVAGPAAAADVQGCWSRAYAPPHLAAHPRQKVQRIDVLVSPMKGNEPFIANAVVTANVRGVRAYRVASGDCTAQGSGLHCAIDDDGGSFLLTKAGAQLRLEIQSDLRLIRPNDAPGDGPETNLLRDSAEDRTYLLDSAPRKACR